MISADGFLYTSMPASNSDGTSSKLSARPPLAVKASRPLISVRTWVRPRMAMVLPSP